ncbi:MAG: valine--tRNA ligase [Methylocystis sp.]|nr:valine--tRNA ligase [Methylocystis sp.]MCA3589464.1 valine--tRNA ligase [Methylocystis sp.]MCA3591173.1 valine--tRNA ligase [Methylocystis sp.]
MMDKTFEPAAVEARIARAWEAADAFRAGRKSRKDAEGFCIVIPPPNVTGSLHIGHALNNTLQDVLCRYWRMRGRDVLWQPGTDHAGIATQMMVERKLATENRTDRRTMGREAFLNEVWKWKEESGGTIINQLKRLGASCDWSRERFTMDPGLSEAVLKVFVDLYNQGLIYKDRRLVNWDPKLLTAISDLEVDQREIKGHMWYFNYPLEGVEYNPEDDRTFITIATTRPETMLGDGAVAVHPNNETIGWKIGKAAILPLVNRRLPIIADTHADPEKGTGAVKITAAHDFNDYEVYLRHKDVVPLINLMNADATMVSEPHMPAQYRGLDRYECRKRVVADLEAMNLVAKIEPHTHTVPHGDRSGAVIEPWLTEQWYVNVKPLAEKAMAAVRNGETVFHPKEREKIFFNWLENIEPWCISRQLWWGHQIPAWYGPDKHIFVANDEAEAQHAADRHYGRVVPLTRDPDVLDTWFSSALWPYSTLGWPEKTPELAKFYPNDVLVTGADILFFWVARMMMTGIHFMDAAPFRDVILHGIVRDEKGKKMSKTTGNVVDPLTVIDQYGADALRFTLAAMTMGGRDLKLAMSRVEGYRNFATKIWNAARFAEMNGCKRQAGFDPGKVRSPLNRWVLAEAAHASAAIAEAIESYRFNEAADAAYRFVWGTFCDWFIELAKPVMQAEGDSPEKAETQATVAHLIDVICKLLHPFMPYLTEELWAAKAAVGAPRPPQKDGDTLLCLADWPEFGGFAAEDARAELGFVVDLISEVRSVRAEMNVPGGAMVPLVFVGASAEAKGRAERWQETLKRLARLDSIGFADQPPPQSVPVVIGREAAAMPLGAIIDVAAEKLRLAKEIGKLAGDIAGTEKKLANAEFVAKAPEEVIEENRERLVVAAAKKKRLEEAMRRLG